MCRFSSPKTSAFLIGGTHECALAVTPTAVLVGRTGRLDGNLDNFV